MMIVTKWESLDIPLISHPSDPKEEKFIWGGRHTSPTGNKKLRGIFGGLDFLEIPRLSQRFLYEVNSFAPQVG